MKIDNMISAYSKELGMPLNRAIIRVIIVALYVVILGGITYLFYSYGWNWSVYSAIMGSILALTLGLVILVKVSRSTQIGVFGAVVGMGADQLTGAIQGAEAASLINALAGFVTNIILSMVKAAQDTSITSPTQSQLSFGVWAFLLVLGLLLLLGSLDGTEESNNEN